MTAQWYMVDRSDDVTGVSGPGIVGYALELDTGMFMFWDTEIDGHTTHGVEWLPDRDMFTRIHGHDGATVLRRITQNQAVKARYVMRQALGDVLHTIADLTDMLMGLAA
jgi:hypothetical protein